MRRLLLLATVVSTVCETYRRGYAAAVTFGVRQHCRSRPDRWYSEGDYLA
jgi:hypothetical protein